jgi:hypothetical protein
LTEELNINIIQHKGEKKDNSYNYWGADKSLARPGRKQATATKPAEMSNSPRWQFRPLEDNQ